ncbi:hypothetical protein F4703DRAFT_1911703 [Phycomyces blakesleeanus]
MIATSPCVRTQTMRTHACPDIRSYFEMAKPKFICTKGYASMTDQLAFKYPSIQEYKPSSTTNLRSTHEESRLGYGYNKNKFLIIIRDYWLRTAKKVFEMTGFILWAENTSKEQVEAASSRPVTGLTILQPFRGYQREFGSVRLYQKAKLLGTLVGSWRGKPRSGSSSAIWWPNPFVVDPIAASWHIVFAGSLVVYCWWSCIPPAGGQGPFRPVIEEHFAVPGPSLQMMLPIPSQVPFLTKQILSIKVSIFGLISSNNAANSEA